MSAVCLSIAARELLADPDAFSKAKNAFAQADYRTLVPIMVATAVFYYLKALRWRLLLTPVGKFQTRRDLFPFVMIGFGLNNVLPMHMGEVVRVLLFAKHSHVKVPTAAASVVLERIFDSMTVLSLLSFGLIFVQGLSPEIRTNTMVVAGCVGLLVLCLIFYVFWIEGFIRVVKTLFSPILPTKWLTRLTEMLSSGANGLSAIKQPKLLIGIMAFSIASWVVNGMVIHMALWSFGLPNSLLISCIVLGLTAVGAAMPAAPGYVGIIQLCFMTVLGVFTDDHAGVFAASIYYHLIEYVIVTLTGLYFLNANGLSLTQVQSEVDRSEKTVTPALDPVKVGDHNEQDNNVNVVS